MKTFVITRILSAILMIGVFLINFSLSSWNKKHTDFKDKSFLILMAKDKPADTCRGPLKIIPQEASWPLLQKRNVMVYTDLKNLYWP